MSTPLKIYNSTVINTNPPPAAAAKLLFNSTDEDTKENQENIENVN